VSSGNSEITETIGITGKIEDLIEIQVVPCNYISTVVSIIPIISLSPYTQKVRQLRILTLFHHERVIPIKLVFQGRMRILVDIIVNYPSQRVLIIKELQGSQFCPTLYTHEWDKQARNRAKGGYGGSKLY